MFDSTVHSKISELGLSKNACMKKGHENFIEFWSVNLERKTYTVG
jgi:hypothetical protein